jgi:exopolysaccharide production protein ExoQ
MANESFALSYAPPRDVSRSVIAEIVFIALLLVMFVGLTPFAPPVSPTSVNVAAPAPGDSLRQIIFLSILFPILFAAVFQRGLSALRVVPPALMAMLAWCFLSVFWSAVPDVTLRRAALAAIVVLSTMLSVDLIGTQRAFFLWRVILAVILAVNWLSIPLVQTAVHLPGEVDPSLIGDWRGLYAQKNTAGAVCVMTALLFLFSRNGRGNWIGLVVAAAATGFLIMTRSKTSLGLFPLALLAGLLYRISWRDSLSRAIFLCGAILMTGLVAAIAILNWDMIDSLLADPTGFTGRAEIWQTSLAFLRDHPLLGAGFGTLTDARSQSPLHNYVSGWVGAASHGHNGYLQILVTIGSAGFVLAMLALVVAPARRLWSLDLKDDGFRPMLFSLFVFALLHNVMESDFLEGDSLVWASLLLVIAALNTTARRHSLTRR